MAHSVTTKAITDDDVLAREAREQAAREIINGEWAEETQMASFEHGAIGARLLTYLNLFVMQNKMGVVCQDNTTYVLAGTPSKIICMRIPDVSFIALGRSAAIPAKGHLYLAPDLAVEIVSATETITDTAAKVVDYLKYGTQQVWVVYPDERKVVVHFPVGGNITYTADDTLVGGNLLPNFSLKLNQIFDELQ